MIEAARRGRDKNGVLQCAMVTQMGHSRNVVTSSSRGSSNQPISFLKLRRDMALCVVEALCATGGGGTSASATRVPCVLKRAYKTGTAALSVAIPCVSQKLVMCMIWAAHKTGSRCLTFTPAVLCSGPVHTVPEHIAVNFA